MPNVIDVFEKVKRRLIRDAKLIEESRQKLEALREVVERASLLEEQIEQADLRIHRAVSMIGEKRAKEVLGQTHIGPEYLKRRINSPEKVSLWAFMQEYLQIVKKASVGDIVEFLRAVGVEYAKRQTIESVIRRKPKEFKVTKVNGQKFISLYPNWEMEISEHPSEWMKRRN